MGAWGAGNWENDNALDWVADLREIGDVEAALRGSARDTGSCCRALAAAEVVAASLGRPGRGLPDEVVSWLEHNNGRILEEFVATATALVGAIDASSELQALFDEGGRNDEWHGILRDLTRRLSLPAAGS